MKKDPKVCPFSLHILSFISSSLTVETLIKGLIYVHRYQERHISFEYISHHFLVFLLLNLSMYLFICSLFTALFYQVFVSDKLNGLTCPTIETEFKSIQFNLYISEKSWNIQNIFN